MKPADDDKLPKPGLIWARTERRAHGQQPSLSREQIVRAAVELADAEGIQALSMRSVAKKLGAGTMSLYWYISSKQDLYDLMIDAILGEIELPERPSGDWRADLRMLAYQMRATLRRHAWIISLLNSWPPIGPNGLRYIEFYLAALDGLGLSGAAMQRIIGAIGGYVLGTVLDELGEEEARQRSGMTEKEWHGLIEPYMRQVLATGDYPNLARVVMEADESEDKEKDFAFGLDCMLDGIAARIVERRL